MYRIDFQHNATVFHFPWHPIWVVSPPQEKDGEGLHLRRYSSQYLVLEQANTVDKLSKSFLALTEAKAEFSLAQAEGTGLQELSICFRLIPQEEVHYL